MCCRTGNGLFEGKLNKEIAIWVLYGLFLADPYGYVHIGPKWTGVDMLMWVAQNGPRWVTHNSVVRKIRIHMYAPISNNFVLICDHLDLNCYCLVKNSNRSAG